MSKIIELAVRNRKCKFAYACLLFFITTYQKKCKKRSVWTKPYLLRRICSGMHHNLFLELAFEDPNRFRESQESLSLQFRIDQSTISKIIREICAALINVSKDEFLRMPTCVEEWSIIADDFGQRWNFHHCIGAMDGKHVRIYPPLSSGSAYYNYKDFNSIVLLAIVDAQLRFIYIDVGTNGRMSDSYIWNKCSLKSHLYSNNLNLPPSSSLPGCVDNFPYVLVGEIFPLTTKLLIPYPKDQCRNWLDRRIFNYRLSRSRRCSENGFGMLKVEPCIPH